MLTSFDYIGGVGVAIGICVTSRVQDVVIIIVTQLYDCEDYYYLCHDELCYYDEGDYYELYDLNYYQLGDYLYDDQLGHNFNYNELCDEFYYY